VLVCACLCVCVVKNGAEQLDGSTQTSAPFQRILNSSSTVGLNWRDILKETFPVSLSVYLYLYFGVYAFHLTTFL
jgi:hypothetical protein